MHQFSLLTVTHLIVDSENVEVHVLYIKTIAHCPSA